MDCIQTVVIDSVAHAINCAQRRAWRHFQPAYPQRYSLLPYRAAWRLGLLDECLKPCFPPKLASFLGCAPLRWLGIWLIKLRVEYNVDAVVRWRVCTCSTLSSMSCHTFYEPEFALWCDDDWETCATDPPPPSKRCASTWDYAPPTAPTASSQRARCSAPRLPLPSLFAISPSHRPVSVTPTTMLPASLMPVSLSHTCLPALSSPPANARLHCWWSLWSHSPSTPLHDFSHDVLLLLLC